jgi:hypothetical protein
MLDMSRLLPAALVLAWGCGSDAPGSGIDASTGGDPDGGAASGDASGGGGGGPRTITLTLTNRPQNAAAYSFLVAYQDGSAAWRLAPAPTGDTYTFEVSAPSYGVAYACIGGGGPGSGSQVRSVTSAHFAVVERTSVVLEVPTRCSDRAPSNVTLSGTVTNRPFTGTLFVQYGARSAFVSAQNGSFTLQTPPGTRDLIVGRASAQSGGDYWVDRAVVVRDLAVAGPTSQTVDFATAQPLVTYPVTVAAPNARVVSGTTLYTANDTSVLLSRESFGWKTLGLATAQRRPSDIYDQSITVTTFGRAATITQATDAPGPMTYAAPAALGAATTSVATRQPYITLETEWPHYAGVIGYTWSATQQGGCGGNNTCTRVWTALLSPGVTGAQPAYRMPDLAGLTGWKSDYALAAGVSIAGSVTAMTSSAGAADFPAGVPAKGTARAFVRSDYGITP